MVKTYLFITCLTLILASSQNISRDSEPEHVGRLEYGGDFSIMKNLEESGGQYKINGEVKEGFQIFRDNGYTWCRLRIFHTPNKVGPVVNDLDYTIALAKKAKSFGFRLFLNFHYSDTWADPSKQYIPGAWEQLDFEVLTDSVFNYTRHVMERMKEEGVSPEMVQIGNEINNGMLWPQGRLWDENGEAKWDELSELLKAGIAVSGQPVKEQLFQ